MSVVTDDGALSTRAARGDRRAFSLLVRRHEARVRAFLTRVAGAQLADDLAQETFLRAWRNAGAYRGSGSYPGWLLAIAWRVFLDASKRRRREQAWADAGLAAPDRTADDPLAAVDVAKLMAALEPEERAGLTLCLGQGWSHGEAAEILGVPLGTLKSRVARAAAKCRAMLEAE
jgi:RNA polymerase sigma factor (sigma-70 family)